MVFIGGAGPPSAVAHRGRQSLGNGPDANVDEAVDVFPEPKIRAQLVALMDVGLGYVTLGQSANTLSGGECQRVKLAESTVAQ